MLKLRPYVPSDADTITTWPDTKFVFKQWSGNRYDHYPISGDDMNAYYGQNPYMWPLTAFDEDELVGHLIVHFAPDSTTTVLLGFIIVDSKKRGKGYGTEIVKMAVRYAFEFLGVKKVGLKVFDNNEQARRCYEAAGFRVVPLEEELSYEILGEQWGCLVMELTEPLN